MENPNSKICDGIEGLRRDFEDFMTSRMRLSYLLSKLQGKKAYEAKNIFERWSLTSAQLKYDDKKNLWINAVSKMESELVEKNISISIKNAKNFVAKLLSIKFDRDTLGNLDVDYHIRLEDFWGRRI
jgi:hypothetical protein